MTGERLEEWLNAAGDFLTGSVRLFLQIDKNGAGCMVIQTKVGAGAAECDCKQGNCYRRSQRCNSVESSHHRLVEAVRGTTHFLYVTCVNNNICV